MCSASSRAWSVIAPLDEAGQFVEGFGPFTGKEATDPETAQLVFDSLKQKHLLVTVEEYPHIYPFCWRTGDELVFRLVDEWFINMDWRDEIKNVTRQIRWLPPSIDGEEREVEWLTNMRDWMISKKRFWGLALPIWVDEVTGEFDGHRFAGRAQGAGRRRLGRIRGPHAAPSLDRPREDQEPKDRAT